MYVILRLVYLWYFYSPERDKVRQEHEEVIMQLNQRMSEKARSVWTHVFCTCLLI